MGTARVGALLALLLTALVMEGTPVLHDHAADQPAIYNAECPLASLAAHTAGALLPSAGSVGSPLIAGPTASLPAASITPCPLLLSADPRAPPIH